MQAIEIPDKTDNELHIILKREPRDPTEPKYVTQQMFTQFSNVMQKGMQDMVNRMKSLQDMMVTILNNQEQLQQYQQRQDERHAEMEETREHTESDHQYPVILEGSVHAKQESQSMEEDEYGATEYIFDYDEYPAGQDEGEVTVVHEAEKRKSSNTPKPAPKTKKTRTEIITIQSIPDEAKQASDNLIQIVEAASGDAVESNVDAEEVIYTSPSDPLNIKIQHDAKYDIITDLRLEFEFPISTLNGLIKLNTSISNDERLADALKHKLAELSSDAENNFQKALQMLIADNVMHQLNWQGLKGKFRMRDMHLFNNIIYHTWFQHIDLEQYEEMLKVITKKAHKRYSKNQERQRHRSQGGPTRFVMSKKETDKRIKLAFDRN